LVTESKYNKQLERETNLLKFSLSKCFLPKSFVLTNEIDKEFLINEFKKILELYQVFTVFFFGSVICKSKICNLRNIDFKMCQEVSFIPNEFNFHNIKSLAIVHVYNGEEFYR
jgi:hypothetical protein